jgi:hypothetical protein
MSAGRNKHSRDSARKAKRKVARVAWFEKRADVKRRKRAQRRAYKSN